MVPDMKTQRKRLKPGPKPRPRETVKTEPILVRVTASEKAMLTAEAVKHGLSLAGLLMRPWRR